MNVLVSGGFGYIGSRLVSSLLQNGHRVAVILRRSPPFFERIFKNIVKYPIDLSQPVSLELTEKYDFFIHLAAANDVASRDAGTALNHSTLGTRNALELCVRSGIVKFLYFSTFQVYGEYRGVISESTRVNCRNDYAMTHFFAEEYVRMFHSNHGLQYLIVRPTNVYGAPLHRDIDRWTLVPNCFCLEAVQSQQIRLLTSGRQRRDFISVSDIAGLTIRSIERFSLVENCVINFSSGFQSSVIEVARQVQEIYRRLFNRECNIEIGSEYPGEASDFQIDTEIMNRLQYCFPDENNLENEIIKIFKLLRNEENGSDQIV